ncbi:tyrosine-type recombinase/integrase [Mycoplasma sp. CSL7475-4]|uniref:tyrosine-type recombinase/integrase n=1 Tax=Mycoplasma sp. CSL7475-4 TaxID=2973942 RepID=UPI00216B0B8E|nr:tyrosine-type recombinase/integrase [Mycoplasma sp. CSL7475-4]MCS4536735.1 tyrosine-type recombinase/integrase [Mycoplasma sp. CSL7475-4]
MLIADFLQFCERKNLSKNSIKTYKRILESLNVMESTHEQIKAKLISLNPATVQSYYSTYCEFLKFNKDYDKVEDLKLVKFPPAPYKFFPVLDFDTIYELTTPKTSNSEKINLLSMVVRFLFETGLRISELYKMETKSGRLFVLGKGSKIRQVFYRAETWNYLRPYFLRNELPTYNQILRYMHKLLGSEYTPHSLRRSFATHMLQNGAEVKMVQRQMGHSSLDTTYRYYQLSEKHARNIYDTFMSKRGM